MLTVALSNLRTQTRRYLAPGVAIALGVAFVAAALTLGATLSRGIVAAVSSDISTYAAVATPAGSARGLPAESLARIDHLPGVAAVRGVRMQPGLAGSGNAERYVVLTTTPSTGSKARLTAGRYPTARGEVAISLSAQAASGKQLGQAWAIAPIEGGRGTPVRIVGVVDAGADAQYAGGTPVVFATSSGVAAISHNDTYAALYVSADPGHASSSLVGAVGQALGPRAEVLSGPAYAARLVTELTGGTDFLGAILLGFAGISLFAAALVIANTYAILASRRTREIALLRCIGATRSNLLWANVIESIVLGLSGSVAGVAGGVALAALVTRLAGGSGLGMPLDALAVTPTALIAPLVAGVAVTMLACLRPAWKATRVAPVAALAPAAGLTPRSSAGRLRIGIGFAAMVLGGALIVLAALGPSLAAGLAGGVLSFIGVLMTSSVVVPRLLGGIGRVAGRPFGVPGQLAVENSVRNPARASATTAALLVGVTLISTLVVGVATTQRSVSGLIDEEYPIDIALTAATALPASAVTSTRAVAGVGRAAPLTGAMFRIDNSSKELRAIGITTQAREVTRFPEGLTAVQPGRLVIGAALATQHRLRAGQSVAVRAADGGEQRLTVAVDPTYGYDAFVDAATLSQLAPHAPTVSIWLRLHEGTDADKAVDAVTAATRDIAGVDLASGASGRTRIQSMLDTMVLVAAGLLGVAVLIALVGIGNTLSLSVIERTRENGLMRALGLSAGQLRATLAFEAALMALVGAVLGVGLGAAYGISGAYALIGADVGVTPALPWLRLGVIVLVALIAGLLASVLPARQAGRVPPSAALATD